MHAGPGKQAESITDFSFSCFLGQGRVGPTDAAVTCYCGPIFPITFGSGCPGEILPVKGRLG